MANECFTAVVAAVFALSAAAAVLLNADAGVAASAHL